MALTTLTKHRPTLALLDFDLSDDNPLATLEQIKARQPKIWCAVLVDNEHEQQLAKTAGADVVLMKGVLAARFLTTIEELLLQKESRPAGG